MAIIEFARNVCWLKDANSTELKPDTDEPVIDIFNLNLPESIPAGTYQLVVGVYDLQTLQRLPVISAPGTNLATLQEVEIGR